MANKNLTLLVLVILCVGGIPVMAMVLSAQSITKEYNEKQQQKIKLREEENDKFERLLAKIPSANDLAQTHTRNDKEIEKLKGDLERERNAYRDGYQELFDHVLRYYLGSFGF